MLIDTNILIYAINADSAKNKLAQRFLQDNQKEQLEVAHQNIFEGLRVLTHPQFSMPMKIKEAEGALFSIIKQCRIITPNNKTHYLALAFIKEHNLSGNRIFDAYLAATALSNGIDTIATDNLKDFQYFNLTVLNPFLR